MSGSLHVLISMFFDYYHILTSSIKEDGVGIDITQVPVPDFVKYLGLDYKKKLRCKVHIRKMREELIIQY